MEQKGKSYGHLRTFGKTFDIHSDQNSHQIRNKVFPHSENVYL